MGLFLVIFAACVLVGIAHGGEEKESTPPPRGGAEGGDAWKTQVEQILASFMLGPLVPIFTPDSLVNRTREGALQNQVRRVRATVVGAMINALDDHVMVCPEMHHSQEAIQVVVGELKEHGFLAQWLTPHPSCPQHNGVVFVHVPKPKP